MEKRRSFKLKLQSLFFLLITSSYLSSTFSLDFPPSSHGCFWTDSCQNKWFGGCGAGHVLIDYSDDCNGLCPQPGYDPCHLFYTHFHCCKSEAPKVTDKCAKCKSKVDFGDEYVCCMDCSDPSITDKATKVGYCKTGAELGVQPKPRETFKWVTGPWMPCSSPCDGGVRYRDMECYGQLEDMSVPHYPVDESRCSREEMPPEQEACNLKSCEDMAESDSLEGSKRSGMSAWLVMLLILLSISAVGGLGFAGYTLYKRYYLYHQLVKSVFSAYEIRPVREPLLNKDLYISCWKDIPKFSAGDDRSQAKYVYYIENLYIIKKERID